MSRPVSHLAFAIARATYDLGRDTPAGGRGEGTKKKTARHRFVLVAGRSVLPQLDSNQ